MEENESSLMRGMSLQVLNDFSSPRAVAISAGELSTVVRKEVKKTLQANQRDLLRSFDAGLEELVKRRAISAQERNHLNEIFRHLLTSIRGKEDGEEAFLAIRELYQEMLVNQRSSSTALAIASVSASAFNLKKESPLTITPETTGAGAAVGAVLGGIIGGVVGGGLGAGIGAAIGGAAGAAIGLCNEEGV